MLKVKINLSDDNFIYLNKRLLDKCLEYNIIYRYEDAILSALDEYLKVLAQPDATIDELINDYLVTETLWDNGFDCLEELVEYKLREKLSKAIHNCGNCHNCFNENMCSMYKTVTFPLSTQRDCFIPRANTKS